MSYLVPVIAPPIFLWPVLYIPSVVLELVWLLLPDVSVGDYDQGQVIAAGVGDGGFAVPWGCEFPCRRPCSSFFYKRPLPSDRMAWVFSANAWAIYLLHPLFSFFTSLSYHILAPFLLLVWSVRLPFTLNDFQSPSWSCYLLQETPSNVL